MFLIDVKKAQPLPQRRLELTFEDGLHAVVEMDSIVKAYTRNHRPGYDVNVSVE